MPALDFANPLYTFDTTHLSYTATETCYLLGSWLSGTASTHKYLKINNKDMFDSYNGYPSTFFWLCITNPLKLSVGDTVTIPDIDLAASTLAIYKEIS